MTSRVTGLDVIEYGTATTASAGLKWSPRALTLLPLIGIDGACSCANCATTWVKMPRSQELQTKWV